MVILQFLWKGKAVNWEREENKSSKEGYDSHSQEAASPFINHILNLLSDIRVIQEVKRISLRNIGSDESQMISYQAESEDSNRQVNDKLSKTQVRVKELEFIVSIQSV